jgi:hypothetical protein
MNRFFDVPILPTILKLAALSAAVGILLAVLGIGPFQFWADLWGLIKTLASLIFNMGFGLLKYIGLGAMIVIPAWLLYRLYQVLSSDGTSHEKN